MAANVIGHATINVVPTTKGFGSALGSQVTGESGKAGQAGGAALGGGILASAGRALGPIAGLMAGVFATGAIIGWGKAQVDSLLRIESINAQTVNAIKSTGGAANVTASHIEGLAGKIEALTATEAESVQEGANLLLTFKNVSNGVGAGNDIFDQSVMAMTDMARAMGTDVAGGAIQLGKALNDPIAGISALSRVGITFSEDQKALIKSLTESGDVMGAQKIILAELNSQFGGSAQAYAETYAGKIDLLGHAWGTFGETLFTGAMPAIGGTAAFLTDLLNVASGVIDIVFNGNFDGGLFASLDGVAEDSAIVDTLFNIREGFLGLFSAIGSGDGAAIGDIFVGMIDGAASMRDGLLATIAGAIPGILSTILAAAPAILGAAVSSFMSLVTGLLTSIPPLITTLLGLAPAIITTLLGMVPMLLMAALSLFQGIVQAVLLVFPQVVGALIGILPGLAATLLAMLPSIVEAGIAMFTGLVQAVIELVPALISTVLELLPVLITTIVSMLPGIITSGIELFLGLVMAIVQALPTIITTLVGILPSLITTIVGMIPTLLTTGIELFITLAKAVVKALPQIIGAIVTQVIPALVGAVIGAVPQLLQAGIDLIGGLIRGLWDAAPKVGAAILDIMGDAVDGFLSFLGIHSPSRLFMGYGVHVGEGLAIGIGSMEGDVASAALGLANAAADAVDGSSLTLDAGVNVAARTAAALAELGVGEAAPHYETTYNDYSTSQEDKQAKLQRAQLNLERTVAATLGR